MYRMQLTQIKKRYKGFLVAATKIDVPFQKLLGRCPLTKLVVRIAVWFHLSFWSVADLQFELHIERAKNIYCPLSIERHRQ